MLIGMSYLFSFHGDIVKNEREKSSVFASVVLFALFYLIGIVCFRFSELFIYVYKYVFSRNPLESIIHHFNELGVLKAYVLSKIPLTDSSDIQIYRYSKILVLSENPASANNAERMMAIGHLFRSLLVAIPVSVGLILCRIKKYRNVEVAVVVVFVVCIVEIGFAKVYMSYWAASVLQYLRAAVVHCAGL